MSHQAESMISKSKSDLILDQPFFASLLLSMPLIEMRRLWPHAGLSGFVGIHGLGRRRRIR